MESVKYIFAQPNYLQGYDIDHPIIIYPIKLKDYDEFQEFAKFLYISKSHFQNVEYPLLSLLFMAREQLCVSFDELIDLLSQLFSMVTRAEVKFVSTNTMEGFLIDDINLISVHNYDDVRNVIMKQNLMFEQKTYKDPLVQEWANKVLLSRQKSSAKTTIEDFITTVKNYSGLTYEQIMEQSIYQLYADFYRIGKIMQFEQSSLFATVSSEKISIQYFAENIDMFKSPYDDLFVSSDKLNKLESITI